MLIRDAEVWQQGRADVRVADGVIAEIGLLEAQSGDCVIDARGGALLPGLHDHHIHLAGLAVRHASIWCGPPKVSTREDLADRLAAPGSGWLRGIGYHESVLGGLPDARELDQLIAHRPFRMQHRGGRMWLLNSLALETVLQGAPPPPGLERQSGAYTGRLFDEDAWLREALDSVPPDFSQVSGHLNAVGVTGITDMTPQNDPTMAAHFAAQRASGALRQSVLLAGTLELADADASEWKLGPVKLHFHEAAMPDFDDTVAAIHSAHDQGRNVAIHCVTEVELVFALAALETGGAASGDRIEHASIAPHHLTQRMAKLDLRICVQPHFIRERGDQYLADVEQDDLRSLYRLRSFADAGLALAGGSDAPLADSDPWAAMRAATDRKTVSGRIIDADEALSPEEAIALYLADPLDLSRQRKVAVGSVADLCLLKTGWGEARSRLTNADVAATLISGRLVHDGVDQTPG